MIILIKVTVNGTQPSQTTNTLILNETICFALIIIIIKLELHFIYFLVTQRFSTKC